MNEIKSACTKTILHPRTVIVVLVFLALNIAAKPAAAACSKASLKGTYGIEWGWPQELFGGDGNEGMVVGQLTADGDGSYTVTQTVSFENSIYPENSSGTYTIASNCTGVLGSPSNGFNIYLDGSNGGFQMAINTPGLQALGFGVPQGSGACALTGKTQNLGLNLVGTIPGASVNVNIVGELVLNGKGKITGTASINGNYSNSVHTVTGTYTETSGCAGTLQLTPKGLSELHFNTVFVTGGTELLLIEIDSGTVIGGTAQ
jgi:hypothetical protein